MPTLLAVDDDRAILHLIEKAFAETDVEVFTALSALDGIKSVKDKAPEVLLLDIMLPGTDGLELFTEIRKLDARLPVIFVTASGSSETAIEAMKLGAFDFVQKPIEVAKLRSIVQQAFETRRMMKSVQLAAPAPEQNGAENDIIVGRSPRMLDLFKAIARCAPQDVSVLIRGESGTGKELVARAVFQHSKRRDEPFLAVNCAALTETLLESELFGYEKGAFTGADRRRIGKFEQCDGGTIFLDEVGDMSPSLQSKVLRLLQDQVFERVGGNESIKTDVRIISATNRPLEEMCNEKQFRWDLYYRLNGYTIELPALRERGDDIRLLIEHFLEVGRKELGMKEFQGVSPEAMAIFLAYDWPGNVRELQSAMKRALVNATAPVIVPRFVPDEIRKAAEARSGGAAAASAAAGMGPGAGGTSELDAFVEGRLDSSTDLYAEAVEFLERKLIARVLERTQGNQTKAAEILGITRGKLRNRIKTFGLSIEEFEES